MEVKKTEDARQRALSKLFEMRINQEPRRGDCVKRAGVTV